MYWSGHFYFAREKYSELLLCSNGPILYCTVISKRWCWRGAYIPFLSASSLQGSLHRRARRIASNSSQTPSSSVASWHSSSSNPSSAQTPSSDVAIDAESSALSQRGSSSPKMKSSNLSSQLFLVDELKWLYHTENNHLLIFCVFSWDCSSNMSGKKIGEFLSIFQRLRKRYIWVH